MTKLTAMTVAMVLATLVMSGVVHAQDLIANGGVLQAADCQANTLTLKAADGLPRAFATTSRTLLYVNSATADLCTLPLYVGSDVTVWLNAPSDRRIVGRVDVLTAPAPLVAQPAPGYTYGPYGFGPYSGPNFDPYYYLNYDPFYFGTYFYPFTYPLF